MQTISTNTTLVQNTIPNTLNVKDKNNRAITKNHYERNPNSDIFYKTKQDNTKKTLLSIGALATAGVGIVYAVKKAQVKNIKNVQKAFQDVFLRDDISIEETKAMLKRYKEIEKIKDIKEYTKALFEEAKKNYRMSDTDYKLAYDLPNEGCKNYNGFCSYKDKIICISSKCSRKHLLNTMHHEFRHAVQHRVAQDSETGLRIRSLVNFHVDKKIDEIGDNEINLKKIENIDYVKELWERAKKEFKNKGFPSDKEAVKEYNNQKKDRKIFSLPHKYSELTDKLVEAEFYSKYYQPDDNFLKYYKQFIEKDARQAGSLMEKFVREETFIANDLLEMLTWIP